MLCIIVLLVLSVTAIVLTIVFAEKYDKAFLGFMAFLICVAVCGIIFYPLIALTGGLAEGYAIGTADGYLTQLCLEGVIFKTYEGQIQIGTGKLAALQAPGKFSVSDTNIKDQIEKNLGKKVRLTYKEWIIMPFRVGRSGYEVIDVEVLDEEVGK